MRPLDETVSARLRKTRLLLLDVDGVLTDGAIVYSDTGEETKAFNVRDGLGIRLMIQAGLSVGIVTGRSSRALLHRCENLGVSLLYTSVRDKGAVLGRILSEAGVTAEETAFVGDDLLDLPLLKRVGLPIAVADAHEAVLRASLLVTAAKGGKGAVREVCERILAARGIWEEIIGKFF